MGLSMSILQEKPLLKAAALDLGLQWAAFGVAYAFKTEMFYDLIGSSTFLGLTWLTLSWGKQDGSPLFDRQILQNGCVSLWASRLGYYLFSRILSSGEDRRFRNVVGSFSKFFMYWTIQGLWVWITLLPTMILNLKETDRELNSRDYLGFATFATGFLIEAIADYQKTRFRSNPLNKDKFIKSGLWSISRHPNYFGEILIWCGLFLPASNVFDGKEWFSVVSPLFVTFLLTKVSGIPILERYANKKWGAVPDYQQYKQRTAKLVPFIW